MECNESEVRQSPMEKIPEDESSDNFQKFIYDLFDKNGILNDLRAYLRGQIVNVLNSAQTGDPPQCQKHYMQRLELSSQALNILIAEYFLQSEFTYSLSVFVSEIPLSNMVFDFAKNLLKEKTPAPKLRFIDNDVWSVLNYLGIKCDSEHASNVVEMYKSDDRISLLFCILRCMPMYRNESVAMGEDNSSRDSLTSSVNSSDSVDKKAKPHKNVHHGKCKHYSLCKSCQNRIARLKEKYKERKKDFYKEARKSSTNPLNVKNFMKNIDVMEKHIINEMFEQLQTVYEAEVELVRREEESRVQRTLAGHELQLQQRLEEIEECLKSKEAELESNAQHKKQFLWSVAHALRDQHQNVTRAMTLLRDEREKLAQQEDDLKTRLSLAEETLRKKGEEMRVQISKELEILEGNLESIKRERDSLNKEGSDLENLKSLCDSKTKLIEASGHKEKEDLRQHYDLLKDEIAVLKKYIESTKKPKCVTDKSTATDFFEVPSHTKVLNNIGFHERQCRSETADRLINDLKKNKNVNFTHESQTNLSEVYGEASRVSCSVSSDEAGASERGVGEREDLQPLRGENARLGEYVRQQSGYEAVAPSRPRTAPAPAARYFTVHGVNPSCSAGACGGWGRGAGEELRAFPPTPRAAPAAPLALLRDRHDARRHLINQWRAVRRRSSPLGGVAKRDPPSVRRDFAVSLEPTTHLLASARDLQRAERAATHARQDNPYDERREMPSVSQAKSREKSPRTVLKEAKQNLRTKNIVEDKPMIEKREKSPNSMLREAKMRLRKLEIEAEAVKKSYFDFRNRQEELRGERNSLSFMHDRLNTDDIVNSLDVSRSRSFHNMSEHHQTKAKVSIEDTNEQTKRDFDKYFRDYQAAYDIGETHFKNRNSAIEKAKPIPIAYSEVNAKKDKRKNVDYLETPLKEFRKLYHAEKERNMPQFRSYTRIKPDVPDMYDECKIRETPDMDETGNVTDKKVEIEVPKDVAKNDTKVSNENDSHKITTLNTNNELKESIKCEDYAIEFQETQIIEIQENPNAENVIEYKKLETLRKIKNKKAAELEILKENINKMYHYKSPRANIIPEGLDESKELKKDEHLGYGEKNILRVEVESSCEVNKVKVSESGEDELFIVVTSAASTKASEESDEEATQGVPLTVDISPKERTGLYVERSETPKSKRSDSPEKAAQLTRNDALDAIIHADDPKKVSSIDMSTEKPTDNLMENLNNPDDPYGDYPDDFSADVDNYNSRSEYGNNSPISLPKSSENDNFWDN